MSGKPGMKKYNRTNCRTCGVLFNDFNIFWKNGYRVSDCKPCYNEICRIRNMKYDKRKLRYNITLEEFNKLKEFQLNICAICKRKRELCVDHNHETKEVRGLLCRKCNMALGLLREDEDIIWNMLEYLKKTTWNKKVV